jgi:dimethylhistidine N-methyltransferase
MHLPVPTAARLALSRDDLATDVQLGLGKSPQKELPSKYLYDAIGSALFEIITLLPEYGLTRAEERILLAHADAVVDRLGPIGRIAELGSGSGRKTRLLLQAAARRRPVTYNPIEISAAALAQCERELGDIEAVGIVGLEHEYLNGLREAAAQREPGLVMLVLFLGSTIGNFEQPAALDFLAQVRRLLQPGDGLLVGSDLDKPLPQLLAAYDDPLGITAAFNLNLLLRLNRELGADFDLRRFAHEARYNPVARAIEMHIRSCVDQTVQLPGAGISIRLRAGETLWTEISHKYQAGELAAMGQASGFELAGEWADKEWPFAETLLIAGAGAPGG